MGHAYHHSLSSSKRFGGKPDDYLKIHQWFDESKDYYANFRHRALRHHSLGIQLCEKEFGVTITNSDGRKIPVKLIGSLHVQEDLGWVPSLSDWLKCIKPEKWMFRGVEKFPSE